jgi:hypothetical protein
LAMKILKTAFISALSICAGIMAIPVNGRGDEFKLTPSIGAREEYNDNIFFDNSHEKDDFITTILPALELSERTERFNLMLATAVSPYFYAKNSDLNDVDQDYRGNTSYRLTERFTAAGDARYTVDHRANRDIEETGLVQSTKTRRRQRYGADLNYALSEKAALDLSGSYQQDNWSGHNPEEEDLQAGSAGLGLSYNLAEWIRNTIGRINAGFARYDYQTSDSDYYFGSVGAQHLFSERLSLETDVGIRYLDAKFDTTKPDATSSTGFKTVTENGSGWGGIGHASLKYRSEKTHYSLSGLHDINAASGETGPTQLTRVVFDVGHRAAEKLVFGLSTGFYRNKAEAGEFSSEERDTKTVFVRPRMRWEFARNFTLEAGYTYTWTNDDVENHAAQRNDVYVQLAYGLPLFE